MENTTESVGKHSQLEQKSMAELVSLINQEDQTVPHSVAVALPQITALATAIYEKMAMGGRLFYIGAGTSGRLGVVDASEIPPTFGVEQGRVVGLIAGGDGAIRKAVEFAEDDDQQAWLDLLAHHITQKDIVVGIAASGRTPYVVGGLAACLANGIATGCIVCNVGSAVAAQAQYAVEVPVGPEFVTGSTRMKAGTAQKLVLNMLTTSVMIKLGHVVGTKMVDMQLSNHKLVERGTKMVMDATGLNNTDAQALLLEKGSVRAAITAVQQS